MTDPSQRASPGVDLRATETPPVGCLRRNTRSGRGRHFLMMRQTLDAQQALDYGVVQEVMPHAALSDPAWQIARGLARQPTMSLRYAIREDGHNLFGIDIARTKAPTALGFGKATPSRSRRSPRPSSRPPRLRHRPRGDASPAPMTAVTSRRRNRRCRSPDTG